MSEYGSNPRKQLCLSQAMQGSSLTLGRMMSKVGRWVDKEDRRDGRLFGSLHIPLAPESPLLSDNGPLLDL